MTIVVTEDVAAGSSAGVVNGRLTATRVFTVTITDPATEKMATILTGGYLPDYLEAHPDFTGIANVTAPKALEFDIQPDAADTKNFRATVVYGFPDVAESVASEEAEDSIIQVGATVSSSKTNIDKDGNQIIVTLASKPNQTGEVDIQAPETVITFQRKEATSPLAKSAANVGHVNSTTIGGFAAKTLLCTGIQGESSDKGLNWEVSYAFQYRPATWAATVVYIDPETDKPHADVVIATDTGVVTVDIYPEADFDELDLDW